MIESTLENISIGDTEGKFKEEVRYLVILLDKKLNFYRHICLLLVELERTNILKVIAGWVGHSETSLAILKHVVRRSERGRRSSETDKQQRFKNLPKSIGNDLATS